MGGDCVGEAIAEPDSGDADELSSGVGSEEADEGPADEWGAVELPGNDDSGVPGDTPADGL